MSDSDWLAAAFEEHRAHLRAVAYRLLGSASDADDAVQDTWLRLNGADTGEVENLGGWLTTVVARVSLNMLRSRRREEPVGGDWPDAMEPAAGASAGAAAGSVTPPARPAGNPEDEAVLADSVGLALLVVLDTLNPAERLAFVLHDMFAMPFAEVGGSARALAGGHAAAGQPGAAPDPRRGQPGPGRRPGPPAGGWRPRSSPHRGAAISPPWSRCWTPTSRWPVTPRWPRPASRCCSGARTR